MRLASSPEDISPLFFRLGLLKDWPRLRKSLNVTGGMFWEINRGGALILPRAQGLVFMARR